MDLLGSLIFFCLEMLLVVSASYSVSRGVSYQPVEHHALRGQSFMNISGISAIRCSARCLSHHGCFSFNYDHINRVCQMNNATRQQKYDYFQEMQSFSYYDATAKPMSYQNQTLSSDGVNVCSNFDRLGLEDGSIPDGSLSASSSWAPQGVYTDISTPVDGRLNKIPPHADIIGAWCPYVSDYNQWIQVDLDSSTYVTGVLTQGRWQHVQWVTKFKVQYESPSPANLVDVKDRLGQTEIFDGNTDSNGIVERRFFEPVFAVKVRIVPIEWNDFIALRFELLGCKHE
ncbi:retinoschisin-like [Asterias amurensis]|uniref:retinoschisin-like n=1 Tax=Asterias amurensis TaxID=7602 RepID=UPI003AB335D5